MFDDITYESIKAEMLAEITQTDRREGSFVNDILSAAALEGEKVWAGLRRATSIFFLENCTGEYADGFAKEYGIYRKEGKKAKGKVTFTGAPGVEIPAGTLCATSAGLLFATTEGGVIDETGSITLLAEADEIGDKYNILSGYINTLPVALRDVTAVTNAEGFLGGTETETDAELIARLLLRLRTPATSGNVYHYMQWAMAVDGVGNVRIFPLDNGPGTVGVMPITSSGRAPGEDILQAVAAHIEEERPIGASVSVYPPEEVLINIEAALQITPAATIESVKKAYQKKLEAYIKESVFVLPTVDYYKCLAMFYEVDGVVAVKSFLLNNGESSVSIGKKQVQVLGDITISGVTAE